jgi:hypothetical protein
MAILWKNRECPWIAARERGSPEGALTRKDAPLQVLTFPRVLDSEVWLV